MNEAVTPETAAVTDTESAIERVASMMSEPERPPEEEEEQRATPEAEPVEENEEPSDDGGSDEEGEEAEPEDDSVELPDTLHGFAEELGVSPDDLANHIRVTAKINGVEEEVTLHEAVRGYQREADYSRQTMELAEQRKAFQAEAQQAQERWQQRVESLDTALEAAEKLYMGPSPEHLTQLLNEDPAEYLRVKEQMERQNQAVNALKAEREQARREQMQQTQMSQMQYRQEQQRLLAQKVPEVNDPESLKDFERNISQSLKDYGYSDDEVTQAFLMFDHRNILIVRDAMKYRQMEQGKGKLTKKLKALPKVSKPGAAVNRGKEDALKTSKDRLRSMRKKGKAAQTQAGVDFVKQFL